jgi:hypothetical protein
VTLSPAIGITAYLEAGGTLENAQAMAAHEGPRTTKLYDRTGDEITLDEVGSRFENGACNRKGALPPDQLSRYGFPHVFRVTKSRKRENCAEAKPPRR